MQDFFHPQQSTLKEYRFLSYWTSECPIMNASFRNPEAWKKTAGPLVQDPFSGSMLVFHISMAVQTPANSTIKTTPPKLPYEPSAAGKTKTGHNLWRFSQKLRLAGNQSETDPPSSRNFGMIMEAFQNGDLIDLYKSTHRGLGKNESSWMIPCRVPHKPPPTSSKYTEQYGKFVYKGRKKKRFTSTNKFITQLQGIHLVFGALEIHHKKKLFFASNKLV